MESRRFPTQLIPIAILFGVAIAGLIIFRQLMIPDTFGEQGHYRAASVGENAAKPIIYAGSQPCAECHDEISEVISGSDHHGVG